LPLHEHGASLVDNTDSVKGGRAYFGLPTFLSDFFTAAEFYYENTCQNDLTKLYLSTRLAIDGLPTWTVYDSTGTKKLGQADVDKVTNEGTYRFTQPGKYIIELHVPQFGSDITQRREITIHTLPELNLPDTTSLCEGSAARLDAGAGAFYLWSDNPNLNVERYRNFFEAGTISVHVTHYNGCSNSDQTLILKKPLPVIERTDISPAACAESNGSITLNMKTGDNYEYAWEHDSTNTDRFALNLTRGVYGVDITSTTTGCTLAKQFTVSEQDAPQVTIRPSVDGTVCPGSPITLRAEGATKYLWETPDSIQLDSMVVFPFKTTAYRVMGYSENQNGQKCYGYGEITVNVHQAKYPELGGDREFCHGDTLTLDGGSEYLAWRWSSNDTTRKVHITESYPELILTATDRNGCALTDTIGINVKPRPEIRLGEDINQCQGTPVILSGNTAGDHYLWGPGGDTTEIIRVNQPGTNTWSLTVEKDGCSQTDSIQVTIRPLPPATLNLPRDTSICMKDSVRLFEVHEEWGVTYEWSNGKTDPYIFVNEEDVYWLKTRFDGCENSDTVNLKIKPIPQINLKDTTFCKSNPITLSADDGKSESYLWGPNGETSPAIQVNATGEYQLTVTRNGCVNSDTIMIRVNDPALLVIDSVTTTPVTCPGNRDGSLKIAWHGSGEDYEFSIDGGANWSTSPWFRGLYGDNQFQIVVREDRACQAEYPKEIVFREPDSIRLNARLVSPSCENCPDGEINLRINGGTPPYSIKWSTNDTIAFLSNRVIGKYLVWVTDAAKCRENALIDLTLDYPPFQIPNAFTPNGDGHNEKWDIDALKDFPDCLVKIFNRSGQLIWWSEPGYPEPWNGIDKSGNVLPMGAYYYLVWLQAELKPLTGSVSVLK
jgi:gliding motility-associated-like protein